MNLHIDAAALESSLRRAVVAQERGEELHQALQQSIDACVDLFGVTGSGLMLTDEQDALRYVAATDGPGRLLEQVQTDLGEGPCVDAHVSGELTVTDDMTLDPRWPRVTPLLVPHGIRAVLGAQVRIGGVPVGSLDVYVDRPYTWDESDRRAIVRYSGLIETVLTTALAAKRAGDLAGQLQYALDYRVVIERAVGYLMARDHVDATAAFDRLRRATRSSRRKIGDVAGDLLASGRLDGEAP
jgi:GAF domain-containing protein